MPTYNEKARPTQVIFNDDGVVTVITSVIAIRDGEEFASRERVRRITPYTDISNFPAAAQNMLNLWWDTERRARFDAAYPGEIV